MRTKDILVIEDSPEVQMLVAATIGGTHTLDAAINLEQARKKLKEKSYRLILLDISLPDGNGFHFCSEIKMNSKTRDIPIIFLTGKGEPTDKVMGFTLGAEDYIVKPIEPLEFLARITAKFRTLSQQKEREQNQIKGVFRINSTKQKISILRNENEDELELTHNEFKLLLYFISHEDHILSRNQLLDEVWGNSVNVTDRTVDTHIYWLRKKLGNYGTFIKSVPKVGYRFSQNLSREEAA